MKNPSPIPPTVFASVAAIPPIMTLTEAAGVARVSRGYLHLEIKRGKLPTVKQHKRRLVLGDDLMKYLRNERVTGIGSPPEAA